MIASPRIFGANSRLKVGVIGVGGRARWLMQYFGKELDDVDLVAVADCYLARCYNKDPRQRGTPFNEGWERWAKYDSYQKMLEKEKLDAVWVETTTHARARAAIHAMQAGVDVYAEKPIHLTVEEGRAMVRAARKYNRVFQAGSQQRSMPINRYASELVRTGKIGKVKTVQVCNYMPGLVWMAPPEAHALPEGLDWDEWCNQTELRPYHPTLHRGWSNYVHFDDGGESWGVSGWGTHGLDQVQCALGMDRTGPTEIWTEDRETKDLPDWPLMKEAGFRHLVKRKPVVLKFATGTEVRLEEPGKNSHSQLGGIFVGEKGTIEIVRGDYTANPPELRKNSPDVLPEGKGEDVPHLRNFVDCVRSRKLTNADVETAHRATTLCHLVSICRLLDRKLRWDPEAERLIGDEQANAMLSRPRRKGYELPGLA